MTTRRLLGLSGIFLALLALGAFLAVISFYAVVANLIDVHQDVISRHPSPDGKLEVVLFTRDAGATTSTAYAVDVVPKGDAPDVDDALVVADKVDDPAKIKVEWSGGLLIIDWPPSRVFRVPSSSQARYRGPRPRR